MRCFILSVLSFNLLSFTSLQHPFFYLTLSIISQINLQKKKKKKNEAISFLPHFYLRANNIYTSFTNYYSSTLKMQFYTFYITNKTSNQYLKKKKQKTKNKNKTKPATCFSFSQGHTFEQKISNLFDVFILEQLTSHAYREFSGT